MYVGDGAKALLPVVVGLPTGAPATVLGLELDDDRERARRAFPFVRSATMVVLVAVLVAVVLVLVLLVALLLCTGACLGIIRVDSAVACVTASHHPCAAPRYHARVAGTRTRRSRMCLRFTSNSLLASRLRLLCICVCILLRQRFCPCHIHVH